ncbi:TPM domain-containing protein [Methylobacterium gnaphalii]|uniref:Membrane protein n=1 Tax=Methylobacterium gnaphalii TaxID=1010610 RepID=A0A512JEG4_9HYPH|nr:TPM domain-containing protein [Methylobacterium gnaphalii]GEP08338.1 membrane protein [Methylobacterium gnaphalii]GJD67886.1 hypothetical protein MMMDOFMJ_0804 [Methylobacterium gnaphalii]GLS51031.1 membrane protein [Methylobacterium gnaphalii]
MTGKRRPALSLSERAGIAAEIARAERATSGEIVVLVAARSGLYRSAAPVLALLCALFVPWPLIGFTALSAASIAAIQAAVALAALLAAMDQRVRIGLVPAPIRRQRVRDAARREFEARGLVGTENRTGVLIYVALAERHAEIVADEAVRARIPDEAWREVIAELTEAAGRGALGPGLLAAVGRVGSTLADALPAGPTRNELPNRVVLLN